MTTEAVKRRVLVAIREAHFAGQDCLRLDGIGGEDTGTAIREGARMGWIVDVRQDGVWVRRPGAKR